MAIYIEYIWQCHFYPSMPLEYTMFILVAYPAHQCRVYHIWFSVIWFNLNCNWSPKVATIRKRICRILSPAELQCHCQMQQVPLKRNIFSFFIMLTINCLEKSSLQKAMLLYIFLPSSNIGFIFRCPLLSIILFVILDIFVCNNDCRSLDSTITTRNGVQMWVNMI